MIALDAHVVNGRIVVDERVDLPDGSNLRVFAYPRPMDGLTAEERGAIEVHVADLVARLPFLREVPELREGRVEIVAIARDAGKRTKVAVRAVDTEVDPVGALIGEGGGRILRIVRLLGDSSVDVVPWSADAATFVCSALAPLEIVRIIIDEERHRMELFVPDEQVAGAPGEDGLRLQLAAELTGWGIDVFRLSRYRSAK